MEKVRQAMEIALEEHWEQWQPPVHGDLAAAAKPTALTVRARKQAPIAPWSPFNRGANRTPRVRVTPVSDATLLDHRLVAALEDNPQRESYCLLQAAVAELLARKNVTVLGVTGPRSGHGKTLTAANLAISLALEARRSVLLVDLDLRRPGIHALFGVEATAGVEGCLFGGAVLPDPLFSPSIEGLAVLPARGGSQNVAQILRSSNLQTLLQELKTLYSDSVLIIDLPPITNRSDAAVFERLVDGVLLVAEDGVTREADYRQAVGSIDRSKLLGTVLNHTQSFP